MLISALSKELSLVVVVVVIIIIIIIMQTKGGAGLAYVPQLPQSPSAKAQAECLVRSPLSV